MISFGNSLMSREGDFDQKLFYSNHHYRFLVPGVLISYAGQLFILNQTLIQITGRYIAQRYAQK